VLDADPLADIANTSRIHAVVVRGRISSAHRARMLADVALAAAEQTAPQAASMGVAGGCHGLTRRQRPVPGRR
jgi:hypothetical protein